MKRIITIKRKLKHGYKSNVGQYLFKMMHYSHTLHNIAINIAKYKGLKTSAYELDSEIYKYIESRDECYHDYIPGIRSSVCVDVGNAIDAIWNNRKNGIKSDIKFKRFNPSFNSFRVYDKQSDLISIINGGDSIILKIGKGRGKRSVGLLINLAENLRSQNYDFTESDIKIVSFIQKNRKLYISIVVEVDFVNPKELIRIKDAKAGCDFGIENPVVIYDGEKIIKYGFDHKKIGDLNARIDKLNYYLSKKEYRSNNYNKLRYKINKLYERCVDIRRDWRFKVSREIVLRFNVIVTDKFEVPVCKIRGVSGDINRKTRDIGMSLFMKSFDYEATKYGCELIESDSNSTRKCSFCGFVNNALPLSKRIFKCDSCGYVVHRDDNAAINCYNQI